MFKIFLELIEIKTKLASVLPFTFATLYVLYSKESFNLKAFVYMFISLIFFDMATTAINNYMDYVKADDLNYKNNSNVIGKNNLNTKLIEAIIIGMLVIAIIFGCLLVSVTNIIVLFLGMFCFTIGIIYTWGPIPLSRLPVGEVFSGFVEGFVLIYIAIYIHDNSIFTLNFTAGIININLSLIEHIKIFLVSTPFVLAISNIMLANNICDLETDIKNNRFLLPYFIGVKNSLIIFKLSYYGIYLLVGIAILLGVLPFTCILFFGSFGYVYKNVKIFNERQIKEVTFSTSIKNLIFISGFYILSLLLSLIW